MKNVKVLSIVMLLVGIGQLAGGPRSVRSGEPRLTHDQLRIAVQKICPVSGNRLGAHGTPIKVTVGQQKEEVFLCCKGCLQGKIDPQHWATIHANIASAQATCPVMNQALPSSPKWTIVQGEIVYVCCPSCAKKIEAAPEKYLQAVDQLYAGSLRAKSAVR